MHPRDIEYFRDTVAVPHMMNLFEKTPISEGACYIDKLEIEFLDGRSCGHETYIEASGMTYRNGKVEKYLFAECDISPKEFFASHEGCVFMAGGSLLVSNQLDELELRTRMCNIGTCASVFPMLAPLKNMQTEPGSTAYEKMRHLLIAQQGTLTTQPSLEDVISKARESATEKNASRLSEREKRDSKEIDR